MAYGQLQTAAENLAVNAGQDLSDGQYKAVKVFPGGVLYANTAATSGYTYVLQYPVTSGGPCTILGDPNVSLAKAGGAITIGAPVTANGSAWFVATSDGAALPAGHALTTASSGDTFSLRLR